MARRPKCSHQAFTVLLAVALLLAFVLLTTACVPRETVYLPVVLARPQRPKLPPMPESETLCLAPAAYEIWRQRRKLINRYVAALEAIIDSTQTTEATK